MQLSRRSALWRTAPVVFVGLLSFVFLDWSSGVAAFPQRGATVTPQLPGGTIPSTGDTSQAPPVAVGQLQLSAERAAAFLEAHDRHLNYLPGEVLIRFRPGVTPDQQQRALDAALRSRPSVAGLRWVSTDLALLRDVTQPDSHVLAQQLAEQPEVQSAVPNYIRHRPIVQRRALATTDAVEHPAGVPNDPWYGLYQWNFAQLDMPHAWDINPGGSSSLIVATVDTGVTTVNGTFTFPLFTGSAIQNVNLPFAVSPDITVAHFYRPWDFVFMPGGPVLDFDGHGTHVSSTIAETTNNAAYLAGMAYNVQLMPVKVCVGYWELMIANAQRGQLGFIPVDSGGCADDAIIEGIHYATDNGARMINLSLGGPDPDDELRLAILYAVQRGAFVAMAGGNDYRTGNPIEFPAAYAPDINGAMSVAATGKFMERAYYSSTGPYIEIAAPGGDDTDSGGQDQGYIWQVTLYFPDQDPSLVVIPRFDRLQPIGYEGTSMATPHVAALAALLWSQGVTDPAAIEALIKKTAKDLGPPGRDDMFGYGLIQPRAAIFGLGIIK